MIIIDIEIKDRSRIKEFFYKLHSKIEDIIFSIIQKLPESFVPSWLMDWMGRYLDKRINELQKETIKQTWRNMYLQNSFDDIRNRHQSIKEAPTDD